VAKTDRYPSGVRQEDVAGGAAGEDPIKVFCSHRRADKPLVEAFAARLRHDGIDAWLDKWEIGPGDDVVKSIERGLDGCQVGLVFLSSTAEAGGMWMGAEVSVLTYDRLEGHLGRVIPVLLDERAPVPALLRPLDRRSIEDYEAIRDAVLGLGSKPPLGGLVSDPMPGVPLTAIALLEGSIRIIEIDAEEHYQVLDANAGLHSLLYVASLETAAFADAIGELEELLNSDASKELDYQQFFERHPDFITGDEYVAAHPHVVLATESGHHLIPDFLLEPVGRGRLCDLLELRDRVEITPA
jgi:hypothetical protein